uniref:Uncharacterized protein n=1 Tax=Anguilla anguilla TaxID=7936 RepID=A0A0E9TH30_ANGAN
MSLCETVSLRTCEQCETVE